MSSLFFYKTIDIRFFLLVWENMADGDDDKEDQKFAVCINSFRKYLIVLVLSIIGL